MDQGANSSVPIKIMSEREKKTSAERFTSRKAEQIKFAEDMVAKLKELDESMAGLGVAAQSN